MSRTTSLFLLALTFVAVASPARAQADRHVAESAAKHLLGDLDPWNPDAPPHARVRSQAARDLWFRIPAQADPTRQRLHVVVDGEARDEEAPAGGSFSFEDEETDSPSTLALELEVWRGDATRPTTRLQGSHGAGAQHLLVERPTDTCCWVRAASATAADVSISVLAAPALASTVAATPALGEPVEGRVLAGRHGGRWFALTCAPRAAKTTLELISTTDDGPQLDLFVFSGDAAGPRLLLGVAAGPFDDALVLAKLPAVLWVWVRSDSGAPSPLSGAPTEARFTLCLDD